jgi:ribosome biogenesis protein ENP2
VKLWPSAQSSGRLFAAVDAPGPVNNLVVWPNSGLILAALESPRVSAWFIPSLGVAPSWCSFLDGMTEELEEKEKTTVYEDFRFVTVEQIRQLGADSLIGSTMLKAHLHGFLIDNRLYRKLQDASEPFAYDEYKKKKRDERIEKARGMRQPVKRKVKVNKELLDELKGRTTVDPASSKKQKLAAEAAQTVLEDDRFAKLFSHADFQIDKDKK